MFTVTYEIVTPDSAEHGEAEEMGFVALGQWRDSEPQLMSLREAMQLCGPAYDCGNWWAEHGGDRCDYRTGAVETRSIHPPRNITEASYKRITRVLGCR
jgi:hypothetical protein